MPNWENDEPEPDDGPLPLGRVWRLKNDASTLLEVMPVLSPEITVVRGRHAILCRGGDFPALARSGGKAAWAEGSRGMMWDCEAPFEAWWYEEMRNGTLFPCLEIADAEGRGMFKLCYNVGLPPEDETLIRELRVEECCGWDLLHLRKANLMDCSESLRFRRFSPYGRNVREIFEEAGRRCLRLGVVTSAPGIQAWDLMPAIKTYANCCWLGIGHGRDFLHVEHAGLRSAEVYREGGSGTAVFRDDQGHKALVMIAPEGVEMEAIEALKKICPYDGNATSRHESEDPIVDGHPDGDGRGCGQGNA